MSQRKGDEESQTTSGNGSSKKEIPWWMWKKRSPNSGDVPRSPKIGESGMSVKQAKHGQGSDDGIVERDLIDKAQDLLTAVETENLKLAERRLHELEDVNQLQESTKLAIQDVSGNGILQIAAMKPTCLKMVELLVRYGFDVNNVDRNHGTALQVSLYFSHYDVAEYLIETCSTNVRVDTTGGYFGTALHVAAYKGSQEWIQKLLGKNANVMIRCGKYGSVLQVAARAGVPGVVELILKEDMNPHYEGGVYATALQACAKGDYTRRTTYIRNMARGRILNQQAAQKELRLEEGIVPDYLAIAKMLLEKNVEVNTRGGKYGSPINAAASSGNYDMLKLLLEHDTSTEEDHQHAYNRALLSAITQSFGPNRLRLVEALVEKKADITFEVGSGLYNRPLMAAAATDDGEVLRYLWEQSNRDPEYLNVQSGIYGTALRAALSKNASNTAQLLIEWNADLKNGDPCYGNVLHLATFSGMDKIVELLLKRGIDIHIQDNCGQTPLHIAAFRGFSSVAELLLANGAEPERRDAWDMTPLHIVDDVMHRETHPGPPFEDLRKIKQLLLLTMKDTRTAHQQGSLIKGPLTKPIVSSKAEEPAAKARSVYSSPIWNPGLSYKADVIDFLEKDGEEFVNANSIRIDDLLYRNRALEDAMAVEDKSLRRKVRWIHLPANNMTWVDSLLNILWAEYQEHEHSNIPCQSFWGTDPYFVSPDLAPHARFVTPQCERLLHNSPHASDHCTAIFLAMPYIHWESYHAQREVTRVADEIKNDAISSRVWNNKAHDQSPDIQVQALRENMKVENDDDEMMRQYLFKRWPIHLRRTLDQYMFSYLPDTKARDADQVVTRARNLRLNRIKKHATTDMDDTPSAISHPASTTEPESWFSWLRRSMHKRESVPGDKESAEAKTMQKKDDNSPVVMIDQLWLWVLDDKTIVTAFPSRRAAKDDGDLDTEDKTDIMNTIRTFLHSTKRHPCQNTYDLAELITTQCVAILHRADVIPDLDFLKIFASRSNQVVDEVMRQLTKFVTRFEEFMKKLNHEPRESSEDFKEFESIFSVTFEATLLREIQDIKDELKMLHEVFLEQQCVLKKAGQEFSKEREKNEEAIPSTFKYDQQSLKHGKHIERMLVQARQAYDSLKDLLNLKQQQASVLEARVSRNQQLAQEEQGQTILVFTIVTIIFLPLTFMTTVFTLPILEFPRFDPDTWERKQDGGLLKSDYTFGIIFGLTLVMASVLVYVAVKIQWLKKMWKLWLKREREKSAQAAVLGGDLNKGFTEGMNDYNRSRIDIGGFKQRTPTRLPAECY